MKKRTLQRSDFSLNLIRLRKEKGLTQRNLAEITGLSNRLIAFYETKAKNPPIEKLHLIADALGVTINQLTERKNSRRLTIPKDLTDLITEIDTKTLKKLVLIKKLPPNDRAVVYNLINRLVENNRLKGK